MEGGPYVGYGARPEISHENHGSGSGSIPDDTELQADTHTLQPIASDRPSFDRPLRSLWSHPDARDRHQLHESLTQLERNTLEGLDVVARQLDGALQSVSSQDAELAAAIVAGDDQVDALYREIHQGALSLLARQTPVARELRLVAALLHIIRCIERMGDQCANHRQVGAALELPGEDGQANPRDDPADGRPRTRAGLPGQSAVCDSRPSSLTRPRQQRRGHQPARPRPTFRSAVTLVTRDGTAISRLS